MEQEILTEKPKKKNKKILFSALAISFIFLIIFGCLFFFYRAKISQPKDTLVKDSLETLRLNAQIYFNDNKSLTDFDNSDYVLKVKKSLTAAGMDYFAINISPNGARYCIETSLSQGGFWCIDSAGNSRNNLNRTCSSTYLLCDDGSQSPGLGLIKGKFTIGPLCPVAPCRASTANPYKTRALIIKNENGRAWNIPLDTNGSFMFNAPVGKYVLDLTDCTFIGCKRSLPKTINLTKNQITDININIDTGIR
jgi:hypothetical protein